MKMRRPAASTYVLNTRSVVRTEVACIRKRFATVSRTASTAPTKSRACVRQLIAKVKNVRDMNAGWSAN